MKREKEKGKGREERKMEKGIRNGRQVVGWMGE